MLINVGLAFHLMLYKPIQNMDSFFRCKTMVVGNLKKQKSWISSYCNFKRGIFKHSPRRQIGNHHFWKTTFQQEIWMLLVFNIPKPKIYTRLYFFITIPFIIICFNLGNYYSEFPRKPFSEVNFPKHLFCIK
jgi:hypothetical protein